MLRLCFPLGNGPHSIFEFVKRTFSSSDHLNMATTNERIAVICLLLEAQRKSLRARKKDAKVFEGGKRM